MPSGYKTTVRSLFGLFGSSLRDLDSIFKYRYSQKRPDVNFIDENGSDISNRYEKLNRFDVRITVSSTAETYERYGRKNNGTLTVKVNIIQLDATGIQSTFNCRVSVGNISKTNVFNSTETEFKFTNLNQGTYSVVVTENTSGKNITLSVVLGGSTVVYNLDDGGEELYTRNTNFFSNGIDLRYLFTSRDHVRLSFTVSSTAETYERYGRKNNGTLTVKITQANYNYYLPSGTRHNYTVTVGGISKNLSFNDDTAEFKFTNLNQATYGVVVTENISGKSVRVTETLGGPAESYSLTALQL